MATKVRCFIGCWLCLLFATIPIEYRFLPDFGMYISKALLPINNWITELLFDTSVIESYAKSDSLAFYTGAVILLLISGIIFLFLKNGTQFLPYLKIIVLGFVIYFLLRYGFDKIIQHQFYVASPNILHTKLGLLSKDILFWNTMGASAFYTWCMAIGEIATAILLLFNRTRFLGLLFASVVLLHIFLLNIGFDITVKFLSGVLLFSAIYLLSFYRQQLANLIGSKGNYSSKGVVAKRQSIFSKALAAIFIAVLLLEISIPMSSYPQQHPLFSSSFEITNKSTNDFVHFHKDGFIIFQKGESMDSRSAVFTSRSIATQKQNIRYQLNDEKLLLISNEDTVVGVRYKNEKMPLLQDKVHVYLEQFLP